MSTSLGINNTIISLAVDVDREYKKVAARLADGDLGGAARVLGSLVLRDTPHRWDEFQRCGEAVGGFADTPGALSELLEEADRLLDEVTATDVAAVWELQGVVALAHRAFPEDRGLFAPHLAVLHEAGEAAGRDELQEGLNLVRCWGVRRYARPEVVSRLFGGEL